ncbi:MAG: DUF4442 domain-containing protein [Bacteroidota bacterium]
MDSIQPPSSPHPKQAFNSFQQLVQNKWKFGIFMFSKLPSAWMSGVRVRKIDAAHAVVSVPFKWLTQNPFRSTYFACQAMAAEMSTGLLAMGHLHKRQPAVSMLVTKLEASYFKKATERIYFTCNDGEAILKTIENAIASGQGQSIHATSIGKNKMDEIVSEFRIEWSFKARK